MTRVHVVEPTLEDYRGHCYALVRSFCEAAPGLRPTVWGGKGAAELDFGPGIEVRPLFSRRLRALQLGALFWRLLPRTEPVVVMTARRLDLLLARLAARSRLPAGRLFLYFHWLRETPARVAFLRRAAKAQPEITILATTESVARIFERAGFRRVMVQPYPPTCRTIGTAPQPFRHLLYAGAARRDKGFDKIVDLVELLQELRESIPVVVQTSADHYAKYDAATLADIRRLEAIGYPALTMVREPLDPQEYAALFDGAICLQPYDPDDFRDRSSGVTMDALARGAPVVGPAGTWIARQFSEQDGGAALQDMRAPEMLRAARAMIMSYDRYQGGALTAGRQLGLRSWAPLLALLTHDTQNASVAA